MKMYDISLPIHKDMFLWPGDGGVSIESTATVERDGVKESRFSFSSHTGTHIDAPSHFLQNGIGIDKIPLEKLIGECVVVDLMTIDHLEITVEDIASVSIEKGSRILFKTGNYAFLHGKTFPEEYVSLSLAAAKYLVEKGVCLVGTDFLGIEKRKNPGHPVHKALLEAEIVNIEGLDLEKVPPGIYQLICLPLRVVDADGSPARVVLIKK